MPSPAVEAVEPSAASVRRILIVDDNEDGAEILGEVLRAKGHHIQVAHDAPAALQLVEAFAPDVALLDIGLPVMNGYELAARLRDVPGLASVRLVALTGYGQESDREKARAAGFDHYLVKPVDFELVEAAVTGKTDP